MRLLFEIDLKNYDKNGKAFKRPSARAIIIKDKKFIWFIAWFMIIINFLVVE